MLTAKSKLNRHSILSKTPLLLLMMALWTPSAFAQTDYWQLILAYDSENLTLLEAAEIAPMKKQVRTPGLAGAPGFIDCRVEWLDDSGERLALTDTRIPIGTRVSEIDGDPRPPIMPDQGTIVLRLEGPPLGQTAPVSLRFLSAEGKGFGTVAQPNHPAFSDLDGKTLEIGSLIRTGQTPKVEGPVSATKVRDTGDDGNRFVLVFLGDGYTASNLSGGVFDNHVNIMTNALLGHSSWEIYFDGVNLYQVDVESNEQGADEERGPDDPSPPPVDTYFNSSFWTSGLERLLDIDNVGDMRAIAAADSLVGPGVWDQLVVLVNSTKYGGSGGDIVVTSLNVSAPLGIMIHELGHSFAGLADEYTTPFPGFPPGDPEPNVDFDTVGPFIKWFVWIQRNTPLPTPDVPANDGVVGAFEGARYLDTGIYRPMRDCLMRTVTNPNFCKICNETHILEYFNRVTLADDVQPNVGTAHKIEPGGLDFHVDPIPIDGFEYEWSIGGQVIEDAVKPDFEVNQSDVTPVSQELQLKISFPSPDVRKQVIEETFSWFVQDSGEPTFTFSPTRTHTPSLTPTPTNTLQTTQTHTPTDMETASPTFTEPPTMTATDTPTLDETPTQTATNTQMATGTVTFTETPTMTLTESPTETPTETASATLPDATTETPTFTPTGTLIETPTFTPVDYDLNNDLKVDLFDLLLYLADIQSGSEETPNLFDFSLYWELE